jgi:hypothetical protein
MHSPMMVPSSMFGRREQGGGAIALVVMRHRPAAALLHRQSRLGAVKGLDLAVRRIEVEADDILDLGD